MGRIKAMYEQQDPREAARFTRDLFYRLLEEWFETVGQSARKRRDGLVRYCEADDEFGALEDVCWRIQEDNVRVSDDLYEAVESLLPEWEQGYDKEDLEGVRLFLSQQQRLRQVATA